MNPWQDLAVLVLVLAAAVYVVGRLLRAARGRRSPGCGGCPQCAPSSDQQPLVKIDPPK